MDNYSQKIFDMARRPVDIIMATELNALHLERTLEIDHLGDYV